MHTRFQARCERVRANNGIVEALFTVRSNPNDAHSQEEHVLVKLRKERGPFITGQDYRIEIQSAPSRAPQPRKEKSCRSE
jgi:hypothetical protein